MQNYRRATLECYRFHHSLDSRRWNESKEGNLEKCDEEQDGTGVVSSLPEFWKGEVYKLEQRL